MQTIERTVFLSYRRANWATARLVYQDLTTHGYDVFMDVERMDSGAFDQIILRQVAARAHFILILTPSALDRCSQTGDWLRAEIERALETRRNIIPLMFDGFKFENARDKLTGKLANLPPYNGVSFPQDFFDEAMQRVRTRFLNVPLEVMLHPMPAVDRVEVKRREDSAAAQPPVTPAQLTAQQYYERAMGHKQMSNWQLAVDDLTEVIRLNPRYQDPYFHRAWAYDELKNYDRAIVDYTQAIALNPQDADAYNNRGWAYQDGKKDYDRAIADYTQAIALNPRDSTAYKNRGLAYYDKKDYDRAIADYTQAIALNPQYAIAYIGRGLAYQNGKKDYDRAIADYTQAIALNPKDSVAYNNRGLAYYNKKDYDRAIADYAQANALNPQYTDAYINCAAAYYNGKQDYQRAIENYTRAIQINPRYVLAYRNRANSYGALGRKKEADADTRKADELEGKR